MYLAAGKLDTFERFGGMIVVDGIDCDSKEGNQKALGPVNLLTIARTAGIRRVWICMWSLSSSSSVYNA